MSGGIGATPSAKAFRAIRKEISSIRRNAKANGLRTTSGGETLFSRIDGSVFARDGRHTGEYELSGPQTSVKAIRTALGVFFETSTGADRRGNRWQTVEPEMVEGLIDLIGRERKQ